MYIDVEKLLKGLYEAELLPNDFSPERIAPDFGFNVLNKFAILYKPLIDEQYLNNGGIKPIWPGRKNFAVCLTHDVDHVSHHSLKQWIRPRIVELKEKSTTAKIRSLAGTGIELMRNEWKGLERDPIHCYERWIEAEEKINAQSTFFFWPGWSNVHKHHNGDCNYELTDKVIFDQQKCTVSEMIGEIARRGFEIGLHPSWYSFNDIEELKSQKEALEKILDSEIVSVRQHCLHYDIRITPSLHNEVGFKYDSTLGFNDNVGFRFGTSYPWKLFDIRLKKKLQIMEIPLIAQDGAMLKQFKGLRLDSETAFQYIVQLTNSVEKVGGVLTLLWHPSSIQNLVYWDLYLRVLDYLSKKNPWFATIQQLGDWWQVNKIQELSATGDPIDAKAYMPYEL